MERNDAFRARLREALRRKGMTQTQLARTLGVRDATVSDWFNRDTMPGGSVLLQLPEILGVDGHWLLTGASGRTVGEAGESGVTHGGRLAENERAQVATLLEIALRIVRGDDGARRALEEEYLRVREPGADEKQAPDATEPAAGETRRRGRPPRRARQAD